MCVFYLLTPLMNTKDLTEEKDRVRAMLIDDELRMLMRKIARLKLRQAKLRKLRATITDE